MSWVINAVGCKSQSKPVLTLRCACAQEGYTSMGDAVVRVCVFTSRAGVVRVKLTDLFCQLKGPHSQTYSVSSRVHVLKQVLL